MSLPTSQPSPFDALCGELRADALFAARGVDDGKGGVKIGEALAEIGIEGGFVAGYRELAKDDVVGQLFAAFPSIVENVSASQYTANPTNEISGADMHARKKLQKYLQDAGFEHLVLAGLSSSRFGLAWVVAYRKKESNAFTRADVETARYRIPSVLYERLRAGPGHHTHTLPAEGHVLPLGPKQLQLAILEAQGFKPATMGLIVAKAPKAVTNDLSAIRRRLGVIDRRITSADLERYAEYLVV